jgi:hypothetical protein
MLKWETWIVDLCTDMISNRSKIYEHPDTVSRGPELFKPFQSRSKMRNAVIYFYFSARVLENNQTANLWLVCTSGKGVLRFFVSSSSETYSIYTAYKLLLFWSLH